MFHKFFSVFFLFFSLSLWFFFPKSGKSAPCCSRNAALPALILGDDEAQINVGIAYSTPVATADNTGNLIFSLPEDHDQTIAYRLDAAILLTDRLQIGAGVSFIKRQITHFITDSSVTRTASGLGDSRIDIAYELIPLWSYSVWKPQVFLFTMLTIPIGVSKYESQDPFLTDITGNGFYTTALGAIIMKRWKNWDAFILPKAHYYFPRTFFSQGQTTLVYAGLGGSFGIGLGLSPGGSRFRIGLRVQAQKDPSVKTITPLSVSNGKNAISSCDTGIDLAYLLKETDTLMLSYTDQTLLGWPMNQNLNRSLTLSFQHRFER